MRNGKLIKLFAMLAALGLLLSTAAQISTFVGIDPERLMPDIWFLHLGVFVVMIPAIAMSRKQGASTFRWRDVMGEAPAWLRWLTVLLLANVFINMVAFKLVCRSGGPTRESDGTYSITSHGRFISQITAADYLRIRGYEFRSFSGWWMLFYSMALTLLIAEINQRKMTNELISSAVRGGRGLSSQRLRQ